MFVYELIYGNYMWTIIYGNHIRYKSWVLYSASYMNSYMGMTYEQPYMVIIYGINHGYCNRYHISYMNNHIW